MIIAVSKIKKTKKKFESRKETNKKQRRPLRLSEYFSTEIMQSRGESDVDTKSCHFPLDHAQFTLIQRSNITGNAQDSPSQASAICEP